MTPNFWRELQAILDQGFTGEINLHCHLGKVIRYEKRETLKPKEDNGRPAVAEAQRKV